MYQVRVRTRPRCGGLTFSTPSNPCVRYASGPQRMSRPGTQLRSASSSTSSNPGGASDNSIPATSTGSNPDAPQAAQETKPKNVFQRIKNFFLGDKMDKEKLASLGMGAFASYGVVSNVTYGICFVTAWITFVKATGNSPLWPGQWPGFLTFYAGLFIMQNFIRPLRFSLALILAPVFDKAICWISARTNLAKQWGFAILLVCIALGTTSILGAALWLLGGFPPVPPGGYPPAYGS